MKKFESFKLFNNLDPYQDCMSLKKFIDKNLNNKKLNFFFSNRKNFSCTCESTKKKNWKINFE